MFREDEYVSLSALQHYVFCPRQCALIHTEQEWAENGLTTLGELEHARADSAIGTRKGKLRVERSVALVSKTWGISGIADVVEYEETPEGVVVTPVEYKHGRPKAHNADAVQLCAQALCLEEMENCKIVRGYLFYHATRHRCEVVFDEQLRHETLNAIAATRRLLLSRELPPAVRMSHCSACSLYERCLPPVTAMNASAYNEKHFHAILAEDENP